MHKHDEFGPADEEAPLEPINKEYAKADPTPIPIITDDLELAALLEKYHQSVTLIEKRTDQ